jgi:hypothetical protein
MDLIIGGHSLYPSLTFSLSLPRDGYKDTGIKRGICLVYRERKMEMERSKRKRERGREVERGR